MASDFLHTRYVLSHMVFSDRTVSFKEKQAQASLHFL